MSDIVIGIDVSEFLAALTGNGKVMGKRFCFLWRTLEKQACGGGGKEGNVTQEVHRVLCVEVPSSSPEPPDLYDISMQLERWLYPRQGQPEPLTLMQGEWENEGGNQWGNKWSDGAAQFSWTRPLSRGSATDFQTGCTIKNTCINGPSIWRT